MWCTTNLFLPPWDPVQSQIRTVSLQVRFNIVKRTICIDILLYSMYVGMHAHITAKQIETYLWYARLCIRFGSVKRKFKERFWYWDPVLKSWNKRKESEGKLKSTNPFVPYLKGNSEICVSILDDSGGGIVNSVYCIQFLVEAMFHIKSVPC